MARIKPLYTQLLVNGTGKTVSADSQVQPNFNSTGITMISLALLCDAIIGNVQEKNMKSYGAPNAEVVLYSYALGFVYIFVVMLLTGDFVAGVQFFGQVNRLKPPKHPNYLCLSATLRNVWLRLYFLRHWIFGHPSGSHSGENNRRLRCCDGHHHEESRDHCDLLCFLQQTLHLTVRNRRVERQDINLTRFSGIYGRGP